MPFASAAKITLTNEGPRRTDNLYFAVDYVTLASLPEGLGRFHAQFRQAAPCHGWTNNWTHNWSDPVGDKKNLDGALTTTSSSRPRAAAISSASPSRCCKTRMIGSAKATT